MGSDIRHIHLATGNAHKAQEFQALANAAHLGLKILPAASMPAVVEDTGTFTGNARKKAAALKAILPADAWVLADDSGLCVAALAGAPGVESAYFAGPHGDPRANLRKLVEVMANVPDDRRGAYFVCVLCLQGPNGVAQVVEERCPGRLAREPSGGNGFGYDPLFVPDGYVQTYAELDESAKNQLSHRGRAFAQLARWLSGL
ncbi:MAG: RdgB/HAM1 family non-canonical purine NTP pyrophosphatase [Opitutae bacterium]